MMLCGMLPHVGKEGPPKLMSPGWGWGQDPTRTIFRVGCAADYVQYFQQASSK